MPTVTLTREQIENAEHGLIEVRDPDGNPVGHLPAKLIPPEVKAAAERIARDWADPENPPRTYPEDGLVERTLERIRAEEAERRRSDGDPA